MYTHLGARAFSKVVVRLPGSLPLVSVQLVPVYLADRTPRSVSLSVFFCAFSFCFVFFQHSSSVWSSVSRCRRCSMRSIEKEIEGGKRKTGKVFTFCSKFGAISSVFFWGQFDSVCSLAT